MLTEALRKKVDQYKDIYVQLKRELKWKVSDQRTLMMIASMYAVNGQSFNLKRFLDLSHYIKDQVSVFSTLKSYQRFTTAAMLDVRFEQPREKFHEFIHLYEEMVEGGFGRGTFTYIAALVMLSNTPNRRDRQECIKKSLAVYKGMKAEHLFLTSSSDYPLAVLLAKAEGDVDELINHIELFYKKLNDNGFRKGNDLQFLSHILSLDHGTEADLLVERCTRLFDAFKQSGSKPKAMHYPVVGLLALIDDGVNEIETIRQTVDELNSEKEFKWHKDLNFMMAVHLFMSEKTKDSTLLEAGIYTTLETLIQAQQAAMIATVAGTTDAADSSGGGDG
ncbi:MAG TPA: DUF4003 domain-containing protein [Bacillus sp. (in: firmicutes)]|nr:DUF4003 domain-containing protein [Bacillus sp. (in: firmicutes)]